MVTTYADFAGMSFGFADFATDGAADKPVMAKAAPRTMPRVSLLVLEIIWFSLVVVDG
jgi:hypothetical protein